MMTFLCDVIYLREPITKIRNMMATSNSDVFPTTFRTSGSYVADSRTSGVSADASIYVNDLFNLIVCLYTNL